MILAMNDNLLGYLLDGLDDTERLQVEADLLESPEARRRLALFKQALRPLDVDREEQGHYRDLTKQAPRNVAGVVVPVLADAGVLSPSFSVRCPAIGRHLGCTWTVPDLFAMSEEQFQTQAPNLALCYAFALGYRD